jgi:hypothetical protein
MTQVFADDDQVGGMGMLTRGGQIPIQAAPGYRPLPALGPAMRAGKGVRPISCVGCSRDTLPRQDDGAPLCQRCSEVLASADVTPAGANSSDPGLAWSPRWFRRRPTAD